MAKSNPPSRKGKTNSPAHKRAQSTAGADAWRDPDKRARITAARHGKSEKEVKDQMGETVQEARDRKAIADATAAENKAEIATLDLEVRKGNVLMLEDVSLALTSLTAAINGKFGSIGRRLGKRLSKETDPAKITGIINDEIAKAQNALKNFSVEELAENALADINAKEVGKVGDGRRKGTRTRK